MAIDLRQLSLDINAALKKGSVAPATIQSAGDITGFIPTGIEALDAILGGGWPMGRIVEIFGHESDGKSTVLAEGFLQCQEMGGVPGLVDAEATFDKPRYRRMGGSLAKLLMCEADSLEVIFTMIPVIITKARAQDPHAPILIGVDTLASSSTEDELEGDRYGSGMSSRSRMIKEFFRRLSRDIAKMRVVVIFLNQTIDDFKSQQTHGPAETTPGGRGLKFHSSIRIKVSRAGWIEVNDPGSARGTKRVGMNVRLRLVKSKVCRPEQEIITKLMFDTGFDNDLTALELLQGEGEADCIKKSGSWKMINIGGKEYKFQSDKKFQRLCAKPGVRGNLLKALYRKYGPRWWREARKAVKEKVIEHKGKQLLCAKTTCTECPLYIQANAVQKGAQQCELVHHKRLLGMKVPNDDLLTFEMASKPIKKKKSKGKGKKDAKDAKT